jgi:hypothetical protein
VACEQLCVLGKPLLSLLLGAIGLRQRQAADRGRERET